MTRLSVVSYNARGLRSRVKRRAIFRHMHLKYPKHIICIQETHSTAELEQRWRNEWGWNVMYSHGSALSTGVAIFFPRSFTVPIQKMFWDDDGRIIAIQFTLDEEVFAIIGVYAPAVDVQKQKVAFLKRLAGVLEEYVCDSIILCGDFNMHLGPLDAELRKYKATKASKILHELINQSGLKDIWRVQNPTRREFTWRRVEPLQQSRIDYIFVSEILSCNYEIQSAIQAGIRSDHSIITVTAESAQRQRGPGLYRFNNELLSDTEFVTLSKNEIQNALNEVGKYEGDVIIGVKLDMLLSSIRSIAIRRSKLLAREMRKEEENLLRYITECEKDLTEIKDTEKIEYENSKGKLEEITSRRAKRAILASGARWVEEGEKATAYFLNRGKQMSAQKMITQVMENGKKITDNKEILEYCAKYYENIFRSSGIDRPTMERFMSSEGVPKLSNEERQKCEGPISNEECKEALSKMNRNRAPGVTGFTPEFFLHFWEEVGGLITKYVNDAFRNGVFINQRRGVVTLIPKKGEQSELANKRPICLLDVIYKMVAKVVACRIGFVIDQLISPEQTGFVKGRYIGENVRLISDVIDYCQIDNSEGIIIACDYRAAFDSLEHEFIIEALKAYNFGENLIGWVKLLYSDASLAIMNNGHRSRWFNCKRGTFQGSPLSGVLFVLAVEILAISIKRQQNIRGIEISGIEVKLSLYADDMTLMLKDKHSGVEALRTINEFSKASGLHLNANKCHAMWLGKEKGRKDPIGEVEAVRELKILGVWFSACNNCVEINTEPMIKKIESITNTWNQRSISIKGRITIAKTLIACQLVYISACIEFPKKLICRIQSKIMKFVWRGRPPKVAKDILVQDIEQGGLKLDVEAFLISLKGAWIRRLYANQSSAWCMLIQARIGKMTLRDFVKSSLCRKDIMEMKIPDFYKNVLIQYQSYKGNSLDNVNSIQREVIWYNRNIRVKGKTVFIPSLYKQGITLIADVIRSNGAFMSIHDLKTKYPTLRVDFLTYEGMLRAIPQTWKTTLASKTLTPLSNKDREEAPRLCINDREVCITEVRSWQLYRHGINSKKPKAVSRWEELGYLDMNWKVLFKIPYICTKSTRLQSTQFRLLHRYIPTRRYLSIRHLVDDPLCRECGLNDTLEHFFYECSSVNNIWNKIFGDLHISNENNVKNVIFGIEESRHAINLIILLVKQYIIQNKQLDDQVKPSYEGARAMVEHHVRVEKHGALVNGTLQAFTDKWEGIMQCDLLAGIYRETSGAAR